MQSLRSAMVVALLSVFAACTDDADVPPKCELLTTAPLLAKQPGEVLFSIAGIQPPLKAVAYSMDVSPVTVTARVNRWKTRATAKFSAFPLGDVSFWLRQGQSDIGCEGRGLVAPGYADAVSVPELTGGEITADKGDLNGDGSLDFVVAKGLAFLNDGTGTFKKTRVFSEQTDRVALVDVDGDGDLDIVAWNRRGGKPIADGYLLLNDGKAGFTRRDDLKRRFLTGSYGEAAVADVDGDGYADAITVSEAGLWVRWSDQRTWGSPQQLDPTLDSLVRGFGQGVLSEVYLSTIRVLDVDDDGRLDIVYGRVAIAYQKAYRSFEVQSDKYELNSECRFVLSTCPRIVGFHKMGKRMLMPVAYGINRVLAETKVLETTSWSGTWFGEGDFDGDGKDDLIGFGISNTPRGVAYLTSADMASAIEPFFAEGTSNAGAVMMGHWDERVPDVQVLVVSGFEQYVLYRQTRPE